MLALAGDKNAAANAKAIVAFETELAKAQWTKVREPRPGQALQQDDDRRALRSWRRATTGSARWPPPASGDKDRLRHRQPAELLRPASTRRWRRPTWPRWKAYFEWQLLRSASPYLSKAFVDENFDVLRHRADRRGRAASRAGSAAWRWSKASLGEALGKLYVASYFPPERKARMDELVKNLLAALPGQSIDALDWMGPETKKEAQAKLAKFTPKIGYPDKWRDYSALTIKPRRPGRQRAARADLRLQPQHRTSSASRSTATSGA